jgi:hypothetical protein
MEKMTLE